MKPIPGSPRDILLYTFTNSPEFRARLGISDMVYEKMTAAIFNHFDPIVMVLGNGRKVVDVSFESLNLVYSKSVIEEIHTYARVMTALGWYCDFLRNSITWRFTTFDPSIDENGAQRI